MSLRQSITATFASTLALAAMGFSGNALAWGSVGHAIVADIAQLHLTPAAAAQVQQLLQLEGHQNLDQVSSWPDEIRSQRKETGPWHYVDIPLEADGYDAARDCVNDACIVTKIPHFTHILADASASPQDRLEALKWVVHFVGDISQPLHAEDHDDKGGNTVQANFFGKGTNLHAMWDGGIIEHALNIQLGPNYSFDHDAVRAAAVKLDADITSQNRALWAPAGIVAQIDTVTESWANESHVLARKVAYADLPEKRTGDWSEAYENQTWPVVRVQLQRGGVRLGELLNETLK
jgi:S1/P1 Nuclease